MKRLHEDGRDLLTQGADNPRANLELVKLARFSLDGETSRRATAAVIEMRLEAQTRLDAARAAYLRAPEDEKPLRALIRALSDAVDSALFEEPAQSAHRLQLDEVLIKAIARRPDAELIGLYVKNAVQLKHFAEARSAADREKRLYPGDERAWLDMLRVSVETRDRTLLKDTLKEIQNGDIAWTDAGLEHLNFWQDEETKNE